MEKTEEDAVAVTLGTVKTRRKNTKRTYPCRGQEELIFLVGFFMVFFDSILPETRRADLRCDHRIFSQRSV